MIMSSVKKDSFISSFSYCVSCNSQSGVERTGERGHLCFIPDPSGKSVLIKSVSCRLFFADILYSRKPH